MPVVRDLGNVSGMFLIINFKLINCPFLHSKTEDNFLSQLMSTVTDAFSFSEKRPLLIQYATGQGDVCIANGLSMNIVHVPHMIKIKHMRG